MNDANAGQDATFSLGDDGMIDGSALNYLGLSGVTDLGNTFTFDVVVSPAGATTDVRVATNNGSLVEGAGTFSDGDGILITVSNISNPEIVLDGFTNFGTDFSTTDEGFTIGGVSYIRGTDTNGDSDPRRGIILPGGTATVPGLLAVSSA